MPEGFDFDDYENELRVGLEVEYPKMGPGDELFVHRGRDTNSLQSRIGHMPEHIGGRPVYDGTVGLEVVSDTIPVEDASNWYRDVLDHLRAEWNTEFQPTGLMSDGNTAGLHIHMSELTREKAEDLFDISQTPWAKVLFCSSIAVSDDSVVWPVFRGGRYCQMNLGGSHYDCVNDRGGGHYEWRLPEPMTAEHLDIVMNFLRIFEYSTETAIEYAQEVLDDADDRITAIQRAENIGMDIENIPTVERNRCPDDPIGFYDAVRSEWAAPEIYHIEYEGTSYYAFESQIDDTLEIEGVAFSPDDVLYADELTRVADSSLADEVRSAFQFRNGDATRETEATEELKKIVKKKKGKA